MSSRGRKEAPVGKGIDARTMQILRSRNAPSITVHEINENAWKAFYASPEGKARLRRMKDLNNLKRARYEAIAAGSGYTSGTTQTNSDVYHVWKRTTFDENGNVTKRGVASRGPAEQAGAATALQGLILGAQARQELERLRRLRDAEAQEEVAFQQLRAAQAQVQQEAMQQG